METWRKYQAETAEFFSSLGCRAKVEATVSGARAKHKVDVWVSFKRFGLEITWAIECKCWNSSVPKEKVLALRSMVEDTGADRGLLISRRGFQSGAIRAAENTNILLTNLEELRATAQADLVNSAIQSLEKKAMAVRYAFYNMRTTLRTGSQSWISTPMPGTDTGLVLTMIGKLSLLQFGFDFAKLDRPPFPVPKEGQGDGVFKARNLEEFVAHASTFIKLTEKTLRDQQKKSGIRGTFSKRRMR